MLEGPPAVLAMGHIVEVSVRAPAGTSSKEERELFGFTGKVRTAESAPSTARYEIDFLQFDETRWQEMQHRFSAAQLLVEEMFFRVQE